MRRCGPVIVLLSCLAGLLAAGCAMKQQPEVVQESVSFQPAVQVELSRMEYLDKVYGSWYGKCIGLVLGQAVEGWAKERIEEEARKVGAYPVRYYFPANFDTPHKRFLVGKIDGAPPNDDTSLMSTSLLALREHGIDLTARDIAQTWLDYLNISCCTAESLAFHNLKRGIWPPLSAMVDNPYQEWIGAQMRADIWGMIAPAMPEVASYYAEQDAMVTHVRNGIYGEQFVAAAVSIAMVETDTRTILTEALKVIPSRCEYALAIKDVIQWYDRGNHWETAWSYMDASYGWNEDGTRAGDFKEEKYNTREGLYAWGNWRWVHVIPNGAACALALLYGEGDFSEAVCIAAMCGYDADCNAGTVGAVMGTVVGEKAIPEKWKKPIHNDFSPGVKAFAPRVKISELAEEIVGFGERVTAARSEGRVRIVP